MNDKYFLTILATSGFGVFFASVFGEWNNDVFALIILMAIDYITGLIVAGVFRRSNKSETGGLSSFAAFKGIAKKVCEMMLVAAAYQSEILLHVDYLRIAVIWGLCAAEIISIMENAAYMDILPESVKNIFDNVIKTLNKNDNSKTDADSHEQMQFSEKRDVTAGAPRFDNVIKTLNKNDIKDGDEKNDDTDDNDK